MGLSLKLELQANNYVLVTNTETQEQIEVTFSFLRRATEDSLFMLRQYKHYELIFEAEKHWNNLKKFQIGKEIEILEEIEIAELQDIENIRNSVKQQIIEETAAKQKRWDEIAAYKKAQRHNRLSTAIQYADYYLERDDQNTTLQTNTDLFKQEIIALKRENKALREKIAELETKYV